jgi:pimeloyl-ACP methyl ester carboxylesterase
MRRIALGVGVLLLAIPIMGLVYETGAGWLANRRVAPPGELVDVGGHRLHWYCVGEGSPTVVLESGAGPWGSLAWRPVQTQLASTTRVCSYDRAGILWSERGPRPRSGARAVFELAILLEKTGTAGPVVLVGHSLGGQLAVQFALAHPERVAGLVLVDASHPATLDRLPEEIRTAFVPPSVVRRVARVTSRIGLQRLMAGSVPAPGGLTAHERGALAAFLPRSTRTNMDEVEDAVLTNGFDVQAGGLGNRPVHLLSAGTFGPGEPPNWRAEWSREYMRVWREMQDSLAALSTNSRHVVVEDSDHFIHWSEPDRVIEAARDVISHARTNDR